jgi:hypothetical protein
MLTGHPRIVLRTRISRRYTFSRPWRLHGGSGTALLYFTLCVLTSAMNAKLTTHFHPRMKYIMRGIYLHFPILHHGVMLWQNDIVTLCSQQHYVLQMNKINLSPCRSLFTLYALPRCRRSCRPERRLIRKMDRRIE